MVFSFFKKQPEKMPERQVARPKAPAPEVQAKKLPLDEPRQAAPEVLPELEFTRNIPASPPLAFAQPDRALAVQDDLDFTMEEFDRDFTDSGVMEIDVAHDIDPLQSDVEQVVVLFANGQEAAARSLLEVYVHSYTCAEGLRFWQLLFDLLQVTGDRPAFDKLCVEFAEKCETSPPTWRQEQIVAVCAETGQKLITLQGVLTTEAIAPLAELDALIRLKESVVVDCGKLIGCDDEVAGQFAAILTKARCCGAPVALERAEALLGRLNDRLRVGEATHAPSWLLLLELLQRHGTQEAFEERAVDYAVTFEHSPPSWDSCPATFSSGATASVTPHDDAHYLSGDLKSCRFEELVPYIEAHDMPVFDFSGVRRLDFFSAGQLVNRLAPYKAQGREFVIRSPNHLVAELMAVVGLNKQARIVVPKS